MNVLHTECSMNWGGQEYRTLREHNYLNSNGHKSWIMCHPDSGFFKKAEELGCGNIVAIDFSKSWKLNVAIEILRFCKQQKIDIINSHGGRDSLLCLLSFICGIPLIRSRHITGSIRKRLSYQYGCSHVIATAKAIKEILVDIGVDESRVTVMGGSVDLKQFNPNNNSDYLRKEFSIKNQDRIVVNIGMIRSDKGQKYYIEAAREVLKRRQDVKFFLIGEGTGNKKLEFELRDMISTYGMSASFFMTGYRDDVASFIHLSDFTVVASVGVEAQSQIVPQTFATRRTVVSTNAGGLTELVQDGVNGLVVPPRDAKAMSEAIIRLIEDDNLRNKLQKNAYMVAVNNLSFEHLMDKMINLYYRFIPTADQNN
jgi:glycosyltransferase involved in cell wall biosynthesis